MTDVMGLMHENAERLQRDLRHEQRLNRKLQGKINRYNKLIPGRTRVWELNRIAMELEAEGIADDALFIQRLEYDLVTLNDAKRAPKGGGNPKYDPAQWPRGERP